jgi:hypothetical protein
LPAVCITVPAGALAIGGHSASLTRRDRGANMLLGLVAAGPMLEAAVTFQVLERWAGRRVRCGSATATSLCSMAKSIA